MFPVKLVALYSSCPRLAWLESRLEAPRLESMRHGAEKHREELGEALAARLGAEEIRVSVPLSSERLGLRGVVDALARIRGSWIPVEYKSRSYVSRSDKIQATLYALILEDVEGARVPEVVVATPSSVKRYRTTGSLRLQALRSLEEASRELLSPAPPPPHPTRLCPACPHRRQCYL